MWIKLQSKQTHHSIHWVLSDIIFNDIIRHVSFDWNFRKFRLKMRYNKEVPKTIFGYSTNLWEIYIFRKFLNYCASFAFSTRWDFALRTPAVNVASTKLTRKYHALFSWFLYVEKFGTVCLCEKKLSGNIRP